MTNDSAGFVCARSDARENDDAHLHPHKHKHIQPQPTQTHQPYN